MVRGNSRKLRREGYESRTENRGEGATLEFELMR